MELGHAVTLSETNTGSFVPVCECGWIGNAHPLYGRAASETLRKMRRRELTRDAAANEHAQHLRDENERIAAEHAVALNNHAAYLSAVAPTVRRIGRWGRG